MSLNKKFSAYAAAAAMFMGVAQGMNAANDPAPATPEKEQFAPDYATELQVVAKSKDGKNMIAIIAAVPSFTDMQRLGKENKLIAQDKYAEIAARHAQTMWVNTIANLDTGKMDQAAKDNFNKALVENFTAFVKNVEKDTGITTVIGGFAILIEEGPGTAPAATGKAPPPRATF